jgi:hypothetical protein
MMRQAAHYYPDVTQAASYDASVAITNAVGAQTVVVRLIATTACHVNFATTPTATTSDFLLAANREEYFTIKPGQKVAAIKQSGGTAGILYVTEMTQ